MPPVATEPRGGWRSRLDLAPFTSRACIATLTVLGLGLAAERARVLAPLAIFHARPADETATRARVEPAQAVGEAKISTETRTRSELSQPDSESLKAALHDAQRPGDTPVPAIDAAEPPLPLAD